jgi:hypothetical protein
MKLVAPLSCALRIYSAGNCFNLSLEGHFFCKNGHATAANTLAADSRGMWPSRTCHVLLLLLCEVALTMRYTENHDGLVFTHTNSWEACNTHKLSNCCWSSSVAISQTQPTQLACGSHATIVFLGCHKPNPSSRLCTLSNTITLVASFCNGVWRAHGGLGISVSRTPTSIFNHKSHSFM